MNILIPASNGEKVEICTVPGKANTYLPDDKGEVVNSNMIAVLT